MLIDKVLAIRSLETLSGKRGSAAETAKGIIRLVNDSMAKAISIVSIERGRDPRESTMVAFGGAGPVHACDLADEMGIRTIVIPAHAGLFSAYGLIVGDITRSFTAPMLGPPGDLKRGFQALERTARKVMESEGFTRYNQERFLEARYLGQSHELLLPFEGDGKVRRSFDERHRSLYGYASPDPVQIVNIGIRARVSGVKPPWPRRAQSGSFRPQAGREAWIGGGEREVSVFAREEVPIGSTGKGPCIIEEYDSTLVVNPSWSWSAEEYGMKLQR